MGRLVCAATAFELEAWGALALGERSLVTGVGIPIALARLAFVAPGATSIVQVGIAGAYPGSGLAVGDVVVGCDEVFGDVGFELPGAVRFQAIQDSSFGGDYDQPLPLFIPAALSSWAIGHGCTVNACTGTAATGAWRRERFDAAFETMEGAAAALIGQRLDIPVTQIRAISNVAADRDMRPENIARALTCLREALTTFRKSL